MAGAEPARQLNEDEDAVPGNVPSSPLGPPKLRALEGGGKSSPRNTSWYKPENQPGAPAKTTPTVPDEEKGFYHPSSVSPGKIRFGNLLGTRRRKTIFGVGGVVGTVGAVLFFTLISGPFQFIQLSHILERNSSGDSNTTGIRMNALYRAYRASDIRETRVGWVGSKLVNKTLNQLSDIGVDFQTNASGYLKSATFDTGLMEKNFPELEGMTHDERVSWLADKLNVDESQLVKIGTGEKVFGTKVALNLRDFNIKALRALHGNTIDLLDNNSVLSALKGRVLNQFNGTPSALFHPIKRIKFEYLRNRMTAAERAAAEKAAAEKAAADRAKLMDTPEETPDAISARTSLKNALKDNQGKITAVLIVQATLCFIRGIVDDAIIFNRTAIVLPATMKAVNLDAIGNEAESNSPDNDPAQMGVIANGFTDSKGQSIWDATALQATEGLAKPGGTDLPIEYGQAFSGNTTADNVKKYVTLNVAGIDFTAAACSEVGLVAGAVTGVALLVSGLFDADASWQAYAGWQTVIAAATAGIFYELHQQLGPLLKDQAVVPDVISGPLGGNIVAYGYREFANINARSSGGVAMSGTETSTVSPSEQAREDQQFNSKSTFAKLFDANDYRSAAGKLVASTSPSFTRNLTKIASMPFHIGSIFSTFGQIFGHGAAAAAKPYNWGFARYGIPDSVAKDPRFADPIANAEYVAGNILDTNAADSHGMSYIDKAKACFGVDINKDSTQRWQVVPSVNINPSSSSYTGANCNDNNEDWQRMMLFVFDSRTVDAAACYAGDDQSCSNTGVDTSPSDSSSSTTSTTAGATVVGNVGDDSDSVACAPGTKDLGIVDNTYSGELKTNKNEAYVKIRLCEIMNLPATPGNPNQDKSGSNSMNYASLNSRVSGAMHAMVEAAKNDGVNLTANSSFRAVQTCTGSSDVCASQGGSPHQLGVAVDFGNASDNGYSGGSGQCNNGDPNSGRQTASSAVWQWLHQNASKFGFKQYCNESWHWDATNMSNRVP
jgi:hypothetical protein